jgi:hypothetical protein
VASGVVAGGKSQRLVGQAPAIEVVLLRIDILALQRITFDRYAIE